MALYLYKAISAPDGIEIDVLLLFSFATIIGNVLFSCVVDLISRKVWGGLEIFFWSKLNEEIVIFPFLCVCVCRYSTFSQPFSLCSASCCWRFTSIWIVSILNTFVWLALRASHFLATWDYVRCRWLSAMKFCRRRYDLLLLLKKLNVNWQLSCATVILINFQIISLKSIANIFDSFRKIMKWISFYWQHINHQYIHFIVFWYTNKFTSEWVLSF